MDSQSTEVTREDLIKVFGKEAVEGMDKIIVESSTKVEKKF